MTSEVREAAGRLRRYFNGNESAQDVWGEPGTGHLDQRLDDQDAVIAAYLAEHADDDDEYINSNWLKSIGLTEYVPLRFHLPKSSLNLECEHGAWVLMASYHNCGRVETRGQLRRLCAALGIPLQPIGQEKGK